MTVYQIAAQQLEYFATNRRWQKPTTHEEAQANRFIVHIFEVYEGYHPDKASASQALDMAERIRRTWAKTCNIPQ